MAILNFITFFALAVITGVLANLLWQKIKKWREPSLDKQLKDYANLIKSYIDDTEKYLKDGWRSFMPIDSRIDFLSGYVPLSIKQYLLNSRLTGLTHKVVNGIEEHLVENLKEANNLYSFIIGNFGSGKSTLVAKVAYEISRLYLNKSIPFTALCIPLRHIQGNNLVDGILAYLQGFSLTFQNKQSFVEAVRSGKLVLLLDGLDEFGSFMENPHYSFVLKQLEELTSQSSKLILTSRPSVFYDPEELIGHFSDDRIDILRIAHRIVSERPRQLLELLPLSDEQITAVIRNNQNNTEHLEAILNNKTLLQLSRNHIILHMILETLPLLYDQGRDNIEEVDISFIYKAYILALINRDLLVSLSSEDTWTIYENIAFNMLDEKKQEVSISEIKHVLHDTLIRSSSHFSINQKILHNITSRLLIRASANSYKFFHKSIMDFFIAYGLVQSLRVHQFQRFSNKNIVYHESISHFVRYLLTMKDTEKLADLFDSEERWVRFSAAHYLSRMNSREAKELISQKLDTERDFVVRRECYISLAFLGQVEVFHEFISELDNNDQINDENNKMVVEYFGNPQIALEGCSLRLTERKDYPTREMIIRFLGEKGSREHIPVLRDYLDDPVNLIRESTVKAVDNIKNRAPKPQSIKSLILDLDGVLVDSIDDHIKSWEKAIQDVCYSKFELNPSIIRLTEGKKSHEILEEILGSSNIEADSIDFDKVVSQKRHYMKERDIKIIEGAKELLRISKSQGATVAIVTGSIRKRAEEVKTLLGIDLIDIIVSSEDTEEGKPSPAPYQYALTKLNCSPTDAIVIENAPVGIDSAQLAKIYCIAVMSTLDAAHLATADEIIPNIRAAVHHFEN